MLVAVTGGTGFLGAHSVRAIARAGHRIRLVVRDEAAVSRAGIDPASADVVVAEVTDERGIARALRGADAVLHAASVYSFDSRMHREIRRTNVRGTEVVLEAARRVVPGPVIHVSSMVALFPASAPLRPDSPVGRPREAYMASKAAAEVVARRHQAAGAPVLISYPAALLGPQDPGLGDQNARLRNTLRGLMPLWPGGGFPVGDVRDTAALHAELLTRPGTGENRYFGPGHHLSTRQYVRTLREITGRRLPAGFVPARALLPFGAASTAAQRVWPWHIPAEYGAIYTCASAAPVDRSAPPRIEPRPITETMRDTVRWLLETGRLTPRQAGSLGREQELVGEL